MKRAKATHYGHCQVCGRKQKVPAGILSKHGYSLSAGFFEGTCWGAEEFPFEDSIDLIERAISMADVMLKELLQKIHELGKPPIDSKANCHTYRSHHECKRWEKPGYAWIYGEIQKREPKNGLEFAVVDNDGKYFYIHAGSFTDAVADVVKYQNQLYSKHLLMKADQVRNYIQWQKDRIINWAPHPLEPI